ncbi:branched-chain amino acid ABC transporter permease [Salinisphaera sp. LB1]|uniref:branched-chain amino acid ABC transporter permease n=1 Tax=Salinisphaera sp. LB1 TaxID=2183911 RepID=UPI000D705220|nr:branched-chain amino acid ABC transporter permease [Salinisphaera sp. LB1]AWN15501.1 Branched-chain amino acid transport system permease protein LivM [Salinisphaera sp. LB1]
MSYLGLYHYGLYFLATAGIFGILALGLNLQWGLSGVFNLGIAGFFAIGAYASALLTGAPDPGHWGGFSLPLPVGAIAAMIISGAVALVIGAATIRLRSDYLAIATLGIAEIIRLVIKNTGDLTGGVRGIAGIPSPFHADSQLVLLIVVLAVIVVLYWLVERARVSPWGRVLRGIRENEDAAMAAGKYVTRFRLEAFVVGSAFMGLGGALYASSIGFISPEAFRPEYGTFLIWVMLIAGGSGNNVGVLVGTFLVWLVWSFSSLLTDLLPGGLATQAGAVRIFLIGLLLQVILLVRPEGLFPEKSPRLIGRPRTDAESRHTPDES